jgi:hypothetical protein
MGLAWQQTPLATGSVGQFLTLQPLPPRLLFAEPLRRRMRVRFADQWIADSEDVLLLHEPGRYPVATFRMRTSCPEPWRRRSGSPSTATSARCAGSP